MGRILLLVAALLALVLPRPAWADAADVDAAARGVVRVVILGSDGDRIFPLSHGTGFAVTPTQIVTNAHVIREALQDDTLRIGIVPPDGEDAVYAKVIAVNPRIDLALIETTGGLRVPPLSIAGGVSPNDGAVSAVGYPMNVDRAQGLEIADIFRSQPPVKSRGFISGTRPSRQFDSVLHTAPIARGNSGGPLLDECGRVIGVNSFGADSGGSDAEFFFAVSGRELRPFLRENGVDFATNALPCRSIAELDAEERERLERQRAASQAASERDSAAQAEQRDRARLTAQLSVLEQRENHMAAAFLLLLVAIGTGAYALSQKRRSGQERTVLIAGGIAAAAVLGALVAWFTRPGIDAIDERIAASMDNGGSTTAGGVMSVPADRGRFLCTLQPERSRVTGARTDDVAFTWNEGGCLNGRTQYGLSGGQWQRVLVPAEEPVVTVNTYEPQTRTFRTDRYLLGKSELADVRKARGAYDPPQCDADNAAQTLGEMQQNVITRLPQRPNERLVYSCEPAGR